MPLVNPSILLTGHLLSDGAQARAYFDRTDLDGVFPGTWRALVEKICKTGRALLRLRGRGL